MYARPTRVDQFESVLNLLSTRLYREGRIYAPSESLLSELVPQAPRSFARIRHIVPLSSEGAGFQRNRPRSSTFRVTNVALVRQVALLREVVGACRPHPVPVPL